MHVYCAQARGDKEAGGWRAELHGDVVEQLFLVAQLAISVYMHRVPICEAL